jgi:hypothetical protein
MRPSPCATTRPPGTGRTGGRWSRCTTSARGLALPVVALNRAWRYRRRRRRVMPLGALSAEPQLAATATWPWRGDALGQLGRPTGAHRLRGLAAPRRQRGGREQPSGASLTSADAAAGRGETGGVGDPAGGRLMAIGETPVGCRTRRHDAPPPSRPRSPPAPSSPASAVADVYVAVGGGPRRPDLTPVPVVARRHGPPPWPDAGGRRSPGAGDCVVVGPDARRRTRCPSRPRPAGVGAERRDGHEQDPPPAEDTPRPGRPGRAEGPAVPAVAPPRGPSRAQGPHPPARRRLAAWQRPTLRRAPAPRAAYQRADLPRARRLLSPVLRDPPQGARGRAGRAARTVGGVAGPGRAPRRVTHPSGARPSRSRCAPHRLHGRGRGRTVAEVRPTSRRAHPLARPRGWRVPAVVTSMARPLLTTHFGADRRAARRPGGPRPVAARGSRGPAWSRR